MLECRDLLNEAASSSITKNAAPMKMPSHHHNGRATAEVLQKVLQTCTGSVQGHTCMGHELEALLRSMRVDGLELGRGPAHLCRIQTHCCNEVLEAQGLHTQCFRWQPYAANAAVEKNPDWHAETLCAVLAS